MDFDSDVADVVLIVADHGRVLAGGVLPPWPPIRFPCMVGASPFGPSGAALSATIIDDGLDSTPVIRTEQVPRGTFRDNPRSTTTENLFVRTRSSRSNVVIV